MRLFVGSDEVAIPPAHCTVARVKLFSHFGRRGDPDIRRQNRVQRAPQLLNVSPPPFRNSNAYRLSARVDARIGPAGPQRGDRTIAQPRQRLFEDALYGALLRLALPSTESGPVIVQHELHGALGHCWKTTSTMKGVKQLRSVVIRAIDFARSVYSHCPCDAATHALLPRARTHRLRRSRRRARRSWRGARRSGSRCAAGADPLRRTPRDARQPRAAQRRPHDERRTRYHVRSSAGSRTHGDRRRWTVRGFWRQRRRVRAALPARRLRRSGLAERAWASLRGKTQLAARPVRDTEALWRAHVRTVSSRDRALRARLSAIFGARRARRSGSH